jgi:hypothetical protein
MFCEITIRRLERLRTNGVTGWQNSNPFANDILKSQKIRDYLKLAHNIK